MIDLVFVAHCYSAPALLLRKRLLDGGAGSMGFGPSDICQLRGRFGEVNGFLY